MVRLCFSLEYELVLTMIGIQSWRLLLLGWCMILLEAMRRRGPKSLFEDRYKTKCRRMRRETDL